MRKYTDPSGNLVLAEGDYGNKDGTWYIKPHGHHIITVSSTYKVTEHEDDTITVVPVLHLEDWHGYLIRGEFTEVTDE